MKLFDYVKEVPSSAIINIQKSLFDVIPGLRTNGLLCVLYKYNNFCELLFNTNCLATCSNEHNTLSCHSPETRMVFYIKSGHEYHQTSTVYWINSA